MTATEQSVIGALFLSDKPDDISACFAKIPAKAFSDKKICKLYANMKKQWLDNERIDIALCDNLDCKDVIVSCMEAVGAAPLLPQYTAAMLNDYRRRRIELRINDISSSLLIGADTDTLLAEIDKLNAEQEMFAKVQDNTSLNMLDSIVEYYTSLSKRDNVIPTQMAGVDYITGGFRRKSYNVISGRSGTGKSDFTIYMVCKMAAAGKKILYLSMEMPRTQIMNRIAARVSQIDSDMLDHGKLSAETFEAVSKCLDRVSSLPLILDEQQNLSIADIRAKIRKHSPDVVVIDHIGLMQTDDSRAKWESVSANSKRLKQICMTDDVIMIVLAQQRREGDSRKTAQMSDVKGSDDISNDADMMMFTYAERPESKISGDAWIDAQVQIVKNRHGGVGKVDYHWQPQYHRYSEVAK